MKCPICEQSNYKELLLLDCGNLDNSYLYNPLRVVNCEKCGHIYNLLTKNDKTGLMKYYEEEYSIANLQSPNKTGDVPGSLNENSISRYKLLYDFIKKYANEDKKILDIGCATGGFLQFLKKKDYKQLYGIDFSNRYIKAAIKNDDKIVIKNGTAENIPFNDNYFDLLIADQVVEHLFDPNKIFIEAKRVLKNEGYICICVPNATLYFENYFFDFYWFLMREHIQHFDLDHLKMLALKHNFVLDDVCFTTSPFLNESTILPNMLAIFKYNDKHKTNNASLFLSDFLRCKIDLYIKQCYEKLKLRKEKIDKIYEKNELFYIWGISREFLYLYNNTNLKKCNIVGLIDDIPVKQLRTVNSIKITPSEIVKDLLEKDSILITAFAHIKIITNKLKQLNSKVRIINV